MLRASSTKAGVEMLLSNRLSFSPRKAPGGVSRRQREPRPFRGRLHPQPLRQHRAEER